MSPRVALYARVSTTDQDLGSQIAALRAYTAAQGWELVGEYAESVSGTGSKVRPEFDRLRSDLSARRFDTVLVVKLDRLGRSVRDVLAFFDAAERAGIRVVVKDQSIDTGTPVGRLTRTILAAVAEFEAELTRDRTRASMAAIKAGTKQTRSGRKPGRPRKITPEAVERAKHLRGLGHAWSEVAQIVGLKAASIRRAVWDSFARHPTVNNPQLSETSSAPGGDRVRE